VIGNEKASNIVGGKFWLIAFLCKSNMGVELQQE